MISKIRPPRLKRVLPRDRLFEQMERVGEVDCIPGPCSVPSRPTIRTENLVELSARRICKKGSMAVVLAGSLTNAAEPVKKP